MKKYIIVLSLFISIFNCDAQESNLIIIGRIDSIYSQVLQEQRKIWIYLPSSFNSRPDSRYPVLYLLDGEAYFYSLSGIVKQLSSFGSTSCPESVIVAIPNIDRSRDLMPFDPIDEAPDSSGIEMFTNFLEKELIPFIDNKYPTLQHRTLIGHSLGGAFVINTLINHKKLFTNYMAIDPGLKVHDNRFFNYAVKKLEQTNYEGKSLFLTVANTAPEDMDTLKALKDTTWVTSTIRTNLSFARTIDQFTQNKLDYQWKYYPDESHLSVPTISEYDGLRYFFRWNTLDLDKIIRTNPKISGESFFEKVIGHYNNVSENLGYETLPGHEQMDDLGYYYLQKEDFKGAILFFKFNIDYYTNNSNSYDSMGEYYLAKAQPDKAAEMFKKAIDLDGNHHSKEKLDELNRKKVTNK